MYISRVSRRLILLSFYRHTYRTKINSSSHRDIGHNNIMAIIVVSSQIHMVRGVNARVVLLSVEKRIRKKKLPFCNEKHIERLHYCYYE